MNNNLRFVTQVLYLSLISTLYGCTNTTSELKVTTFANTGFTEGDGVSVAQDGSVYVSGGPNGNIVHFNLDGSRKTLISGYDYLADSDLDSAGNLYVASYGSNSILRITPKGTVSTYTSDLNGPASVYIDKKNNMYVGLYGADYSGTGASVMRITPDGTKTIYATGGGLKDVIGITGDEQGEIYAGNRNSGELYRVTNGNVSLLATAGIAINQIDYALGYIYIAQNSRIVRISKKGVVEAFAGTAAAKTINGKLTDAEFTDPNSLAFSPDKRVLYVYDGVTGDVRKISAE